MSYCIIIPNYNHTQYISATLNTLLKMNYPVFLINDGSDQESTKKIEKIVALYENVSLIHHQKNRGKGAAVKTGMLNAFKSGFEYAIQVDADGQHCLKDVLKMVEMSEKNPEHLISGLPVFDDNIPKHRYYSRYITHFWVWVETLSFSVKDTMCGFRVYPVAKCIDLLEQVKLGDRMDFDTEIMVRLYWKNVKIDFLPTKVNYPKDGKSHFLPIKDNVLISWMHTRLFFGMIVRIPLLLWRKI